MDGCEEPAPPGRGEARGSRARGRLPRARRPSCRRGPAAREPSCAALTLRRRRGAGGRRRGAPRPAPGGAQMRPRAARYVYYVYVLLRLAISRGRTLSWRSIDLCPCRRQPTRKCGSHKRKPRQPCARRDGADAPPCTPPIAFPAGAAAAPRVRVCCAS